MFGGTIKLAQLTKRAWPALDVSLFSTLFLNIFLQFFCKQGKLPVLLSPLSASCWLDVSDHKDQIFCTSGLVPRTWNYPALFSPLPSHQFVLEKRRDQFKLDLPFVFVAHILDVFKSCPMISAGMLTLAQRWRKCSMRFE